MSSGLSQGFITSHLIILVLVDTSSGGPEFGDVKGDNLSVHPGKKSAVHFPVRMHSPDITTCRLSRLSSNGHSNSGSWDNSGTTVTTTPSPDIDCLRFVERVLGGLWCVRTRARVSCRESEGQSETCNAWLDYVVFCCNALRIALSLIHISEPTRPP